MMHRYGLQRLHGTPPGQRSDRDATLPGKLRIRMTNLRNILTIFTSVDDGRNWVKFDVQMEVSGYHHNVAYDFLSLRPGLYAAGTGTARFTDFRYRGRM
jgi:beta-xylosidase